MSWLTPLGFLGLISILALIIIYIIKPNYENKFISSTFVWKLSLKYKKNKLPINKLRNIILFICQVLALTAASLIIAQPFLDNGESFASEKVIIVDASASMMTKTGTTTRFEKAIYDVKDEVNEQLEKKDGKVSVILAGEKASFLVQSEGISSKASIHAELDKLIAKGADNPCYWGAGDIAGAIKLSEEITSMSESVEVSLFTDTNYIDKGKVKVNLVNDISDVNVAILDVRAINDENYYRFEIDLVSYGASNSTNLKFTAKGVNGLVGEEGRLELSYTANLECDVVQTIAFGYVPEGEEKSDFEAEIVENISVFEFESAEASIDERDSFETDNSFYLYGGKRPALKVQYYSEKPNNYFRSALMVLRDQLKYRWDLQVKEVSGEEAPAAEGFDFYIFEHKMPSSLPNDGFVLLINPDRAPLGSGFTMGGIKGFYEQTPLSASDEDSRVMKGIAAEEITVTRYFPITNYDGFTPVLSCGNDPVFIVKNEQDEKVAVMSFSLHFSNLPVMLEFPLMIYNLIEYYSPSTVTKHVFDVGEEIELGARSDSLTVTGPDVEKTYTEFPAKLPLKAPGVYTAMQTPISGELESDSFFVKVPASESNINSTEDKLVNPYFFEQEEDTRVDLLIFFASALVALLFTEWWLHTREQYKIGKQK